MIVVEQREDREDSQCGVKEGRSAYTKCACIWPALEGRRVWASRKRGSEVESIESEARSTLMAADKFASQKQ